MEFELGKLNLTEELESLRNVLVQLKGGACAKAMRNDEKVDVEPSPHFAPMILYRGQVAFSYFAQGPFQFMFDKPGEGLYRAWNYGPDWLTPETFDLDPQSYELKRSIECVEQAIVLLEKRQVILDKAWPKQSFASNPPTDR